jgi:hypothetical protein
MSKRLLIIVVLAIACIAALFFYAGMASAGISGGGYAQIAQKALQKAGKPYGYKTTCKAYENYGTGNVTVVCRMREAG